MFYKEMSLTEKKMLRKYPPSDAWAAILKNAWALLKLQNWVYFNIFSYLRLFFVSLLMVVPSNKEK